MKYEKYILKRCIPLTIYTMSKVHEKCVFMCFFTNTYGNKSYTLPTISNRLNFILQFS